MGSQLLIGIGLGALVYWFFRPKNDSQFRVKESDQIKPNTQKIRDHKGNLLGESKLKVKPAPLMLEGIRIDSAPHLLLKVSQHAKEPEIQKAYRELMKIYHPDKIGRPGTREWQDAQKIAEAINSARNQMLEKIRSGR